MLFVFDFWKRKDENKYNRYIREKIKEAREKKGMTQAELAENLYRTQSFISNLESGRLEVSAVDLMGIAYLVEKPMRYFFPVYVPTEGDLADYEWELIHFLRKIGDEERARKVAGLLVDQARSVAEVIIDTDVKAEAERRREIRQQLKEKPKK